jgi:hypothetical protein
MHLGRDGKLQSQAIRGGTEQPCKLEVGFGFVEVVHLPGEAPSVEVGLAKKAVPHAEGSAYHTGNQGGLEPNFQTNGGVVATPAEVLDPPQILTQASLTRSPKPWIGKDLVQMGIPQQGWACPGAYGQVDTRVWEAPSQGT